MNDQLLEMLAWQQQREIARQARTRPRVEPCRDDETTATADVRRPCRPRRSLRLVALVTRA